MTTNFYFWLILVSSGGFWLLDLVANALNLRALKPSLPESFKGIYDEAAYRRMVEYTSVSTRFELIESTFVIAVFFGFWFLGGYGWLDRLARSFHHGPILTGLIFFGILTLAQGVLSLPFSIYSTFGIEQRFGFNKTTVGTFIGDLIKSLLGGSVLGGSLLALVLWIFSLHSAYIWLYAWGTVTALMLLLMYLAPAVILPLFNKFTPLEDGELKRAILDYAGAQKFPVAGIYVMDGSKRSTKANAFFTGLGRMKKIALFDTLIANQTVEELVAVLAHEVGHFKHRHLLQHLSCSILKLGLLLFLAQYCVHAAGLFAAFGVAPSDYAGLTFFMLLLKPLNFVFSLLQGIQSRRHEYQADHYAATTTGKPEALASALKKLSQSNLSNLAPHPLYVTLYHSHPPLLQRLKPLEGGATARPGGGLDA